MTKGERIAELRNRRGLGLTDLAERVGSTKQNIYKYETGTVTNIPSDMIEKLADALNTSPAYLMGWEPDPSENTARRLMEYYLRLSEIDKAKLLGYAEGLLQKEE